MSDLKVIYINKDEIKPFKDNPRLHSELQIKQIMNSIKEFGFVNPILIDEKNIILAGHGRYRASEMLNMDKIPTVQISNLTSEQKKALVIADNKITQNSEWSNDLLWQQVKELNNLGFNLDILGFDNSEMLPMLDDNTVTDFASEWENMPEFIQEDAQAYRTIKVHFNADRDVEVFSKLIGQKLTDKTKSIWHPQQEKNDTETKRYD
jgi:ParB-like chromosome segregation protein Spo0J